MQTVIYSNDFELTGSLNRFIKLQSKKAMSACASHVDRVIIRLKDINGPKGGLDKECSVEVKLASGAPIVVSKRSSDAYASIRSALGRASRSTLRSLGKRRNDKHEKHSRSPGLFEPDTIEAGATGDHAGAEAADSTYQSDY